jgi:hypothetical protein
MTTDDVIVELQRRTVMKKLMTLMLGLAFLSTTVALTYAQETKDTTTTSKKKSGKKRGGEKKTDTTKQ